MDIQSLPQILKKIKTLEEKRADLLYLAPPVLDGMPHRKGASDRTGDIVAQREKLQEEIETHLANFFSLWLQMEIWIDDLPSDDRILMRLRYIHGKTWEEIAENMGYSSRQVCRRHEAIMKNLTKPAF